MNARLKKLPLASQIVQVVDRQQKPLAALSLSQVIRQKLLYRSVLVVGYCGRRLCLRQCLENRWDIVGQTFLAADETPFVAADRLGFEFGQKHFTLTWQSGFFDEQSLCFVDLYRFYFQDPNLLARDSNLLLDRLEFQTLVADCSLLLSSHVLELWKRGFLFSSN